MPERAATCLDPVTTGMAWSVLGEVQQLLENLAEQGAVAVIDLRSLPLTRADRAQLEALLGRGEVRAELAVGGRSIVWETAYPGAWWIRHFGTDDQVLSEQIAICPVPELFPAHVVDIRAGASRLKHLLANELAGRSAGNPTEDRSNG